MLARVLGEAMRGVEEGTSFDTVAQGAAPLGLPMSPFELLELVGLPVGAHVLDSHRAAWPERFYPGDGLKKIAARDDLTRDKKGNATGYDPAAVKLMLKDAKPVDAADAAPVRGRPGRRAAPHARGPGRRARPGDRPRAHPRCGLPVPGRWDQPYLDRSQGVERVFGGTFHGPRIVGPASR
ncbi:3-hydroxyacyl-CoA dehydrogenase family protein [Curtobacterium flaccumfaciens pv. flaccumfaciens]|uniref:3-hydroxyacyl-CoA dehydrogenase family protein n=1 Tax=Curtobacterium flaccumfaciens TaxID=2035 RepID=UPI00217E1107|nr:3-hydroxyacyl-CoA dehydrogenase family protein [Curtobacterium flaccumfaciens]MCS6585838.1 3-hydroxyacyl-CoA dehydrogenase family protein [Curtobacterium flaccumfaciens pv. flaccumfaciens]